MKFAKSDVGEAFLDTFQQRDIRSQTERPDRRTVLSNGSAVGDKSLFDNAKYIYGATAYFGDFSALMDKCNLH